MDLSINATALQSRLGAAERAARLAGAALLRHYAARDRLVIDQKGVNDFVSNADREAEDIIAAELRTAFPEDGFLGEETGLSGHAGAAAVWCVDPLDGTSNFLKGAHNWCVSIGLWLAGRPVLGALYDPLRGEMFLAAEGLGVSCNRKPISVSPTASLDRSSLGLGHNQRVAVADFSDDIDRLLSTGASFRQVGAGALMLAYVAAGRVDSYFERHMWPWDAVAGLALIRAAGGVTTAYPPEGTPIARGALVLASGATLFGPLREAIGPERF
jgi:myo-inositol-1(or 4)-monophosphatase